MKDNPHLLCVSISHCCASRALQAGRAFYLNQIIFYLCRERRRGGWKGGGHDSICCRFTSNTALMFVLCTDSGNVAISSSVDTHFVPFPSTAAATLLDSLQWSGRQWLQWNASWIGSKCNHVFPLSVCSAFINMATFSPLSSSKTFVSLFFRVTVKLFKRTPKKKKWMCVKRLDWSPALICANLLSSSVWVWTSPLILLSSLFCSTSDT